MDASNSDPHMTSARARSGAATTTGGVPLGSSGPSSQGSSVGAAGSGYVRYSSPPINQHQQQQMGGFGGVGGGGFQTFASDPYMSPQGNMGSGPMGGGTPGAGGSSSGGGMGGFGNFGGFQGGNAGGFPLNDHTAQMGMHFGRQMAQVGGEYVNKSVRVAEGARRKREEKRRHISESQTDTIHSSLSFGTVSRGYDVVQPLPACPALETLLQCV